METNNICYSGGARGADFHFGNCAKNSGHDLIHYHFDRKLFNHPYHFILNDDQLKMADNSLRIVNEKYLKRSVPPLSKVSGKLLRRNYFQINKSETVYAVTNIKDGIVQGGTAWAVYMHILLNRLSPHEVSTYVFDMIRGKWNFWDYPNDKWVELKGEIKKPEGKYTGIGSRDLTERGLDAIYNLYGLI